MNHSFTGDVLLAGGTTTGADMYEWNYQHAFLEAGMRARVTTVGRLGAPGRLAECVDATRKWNEWMRTEARGDVYMDICIHSEYLTDEHFCRELAAANRRAADETEARKKAAADAEKARRAANAVQNNPLPQSGAYPYQGM